MSEPETSTHDLDDIDEFLCEYAAGDTIFQEGDDGAVMYIVQEGEVELFKEYAGQERSLSNLEIGDFFGEMELLEDGPRALSARATTDCKLLRLDSPTFDRIVREVPEIPVRMLRKLARRLNERLEADARAAAIAWNQKESADEAQAEGESEDEAQAARLVHADSDAEFPLSPGAAEVTIGRPDPSTGHTPGIDLSPVDPKRTLSRRHAKISRRGEGFQLEEEVGTANGTFVNGERLETGVPREIADGDELRFGLVKMTFLVE